MALMKLRAAGAAADTCSRACLAAEAMVRNRSACAQRYAKKERLSLPAGITGRMRDWPL
jgi:hypothetical protein